MTNKDKVKNWYEQIDNGLKRKFKRDKNYTKHLMEPTSMI